MRHARIRRWRVEERLVGDARAPCLGHFVIDFEDDALGAVFAVGSDVLALDDGEGLHDVIDVVAGDAVEMEVGGVEFSAEKEAAIFISAEGRIVVATILGEGLQVPGGVGEFEDP